MWELGFVRRETVGCCWTLAIAAAAYWIQTCNRKPAVFEMLDSERRRMVVFFSRRDKRRTATSGQQTEVLNADRSKK